MPMPHLKIAGFTTLAISLWALANRLILGTITNPDKVGKIVKALQGIGVIVSLIFTGVLYMKGIGSSQ